MSTSLNWSTGIIQEGNILRKIEEFDGSAAAAILDVACRDQFHISIRLLEWNKRDGGEPKRTPFRLGVVKHGPDTDMDLFLECIEENGLFLSPYDAEIDQASFCLLGGWEQAEGVKDIELVTKVEAEAGGATPLHMFYEDCTLYFAVGENPRSKLPHMEEVLANSYWPCIIMDSHMCVRLSTTICSQGSSRKIGGNGDEGTAIELTKTLWACKSFVDASIICGDESDKTAKVIPVHRCVLAAASPFFERAFQCPMKESRDAQIRITDADGVVVEALLKFFYTSSVSPDVDVISLLPLAHRYEATRLVEFCAWTMVRDLCQENVASYVAALRPFRSDNAVRAHWEQAISRIGASTTLLHALMAG